jgi:hypothetical protein
MKKLFKSFLSLAGLVLAAGSLVMSARAQSNLVYAAEYNQTTNRFGTIDLVGGSFTRISSFGNAVINDIAYCPTNGVVYAISNSTALWTFNKTNGSLTRVANLSVRGIQSLAFRPSDGTLFGATHTNLYRIVPGSGTATLVGNYGSPTNLNNRGQNIRFARDGNLYVSNTSTNTDIYRINTTNGSATWMGEAIGYPYLMLQNSGSNMYSVFINLGSATNEPPKLVGFDLSSFVVGGTNANGSTHQITVSLVGAGTNFPSNFNFSGAFASSPVTNLTVPVSAVGPVDQNVCPGDTAVFSTVASGTPPYSYAWLKNGSALSGQTNSSLTLANVSASNAATYSVIVTGVIGKVTNSAILSLNSPVTVTAAPVGQASVAGGSATFSVTATGTSLSYQWLFNGSVVGTASSLTLNSLTTSQAGTYTVIVSGTCNSVTNSATLTVTKAAATVTLGSLSQTYDGTAKAATATTTPSGLTVSFTYNGSATVPTAAGSYTVVGTINDANYQGNATGTLVIGQATAAVELGSLSQTYDGSARAATATTTPSGLAVTYTYNGSATVPTAAGSYTVVGTINDANYQGSATGTLVIGQATGEIELGSLSQTYDGSAKAATATTTPGGLTVSFTYDGSATVPTAAGSYTVVGTINDANYQGNATGTLVIGQATAAVELGSLSQTYDGSARAATATTTPSGLAVTYTYNGSATVPTSAGTYTVVGTINDANYQGNATSTLVINKATLTVTAENKSKFCGQANPALTASYSGFVNGENAGVLTSPVALNTMATASCGAGEYPISASGAATANYTISYVSGTLTVNAAPPLEGTSAIVDGNSLFIVSWPTVSGHTYQLEYSDNLADVTWNPAGNPVVGTDAMVFVTNNVSASMHRFFRVEVQ